MRTLPIATLIMLFTALITLQAQQKTLSKEEAIAIALENNFGIQISENEVDIANNNQSIWNTGYLPTITGTAGATYNRDDAIITFPGQFMENGNPRPDVTLHKAEAQRYASAIQLNYTLFDGMGRRYTYKQLKEQYQLSTLQARATIENTILQLIRIYFDIAQLIENENVLKQALKISKDRIKRAEYAFEYGQNTKLDILNARVDAINDSINVLNTQQQLVNARRDLNVMLNRDLNQEFNVDTLIHFTPKIQLESFIENAKTNNVTLLQLEKNLTLQAYTIKVNQSGYFPIIDLNGTYGWNLNQNAASAFFPGTNNNTYNFMLGARLTWNLFDAGRTMIRVKNSKIAYENQKLLNKQTTLEVHRNILNALAIYENRLSLFKIQEQNLITNQDNFNRSREQFQLGRITSLAFRQAQLNLLNAQTNRNLTKYDAKWAELQLLQLTGQLLNVEL